MSDLHIVDDESPLRVEFLDQYANPGAPHFGSYPTGGAYRPQESLSKQLVDAMCRAIKQTGSGPATGRPLEFTIATGDVIDNVQFNETRWYIDLLDGGRTITPTSGDPSRDQSVSRGLFFGPFYWGPEDGVNGFTYFNAGFPTIPGLLAKARQSFVSTGLGMPWYTAYGNHDSLVQGNLPIDVLPGDPLKDIALGSSKMVDTDGRLPALYSDASLDAALTFLGGPSVTVTADPKRRLLSRAQFVAEHFNTTGTPVGHGFTAGSDKAYYVMPAAGRDPIRYIVLDTTNPNGAGTFGLDGSGGSLDDVQFRWLETQLKAFSSRYSLDDSNGGTRHQTVVRRPEVEDKLMVIFCHHTLNTMSLTSGDRPHGGAALKNLLFRFPNVVLMVDGHTHANNIWVQRSQWFQPSQGFWEVNTASHIDWPIQSRTIELESDGSTLSIFTTMLDIDAPISFDGDFSTLQGMASLGRELSLNDIQERLSTRRGTDGDRNAQLLIPMPAPIVTWGSPIAMAKGIDGRMEMFGVNGADQVFHNRQDTVGGATSPWMLFDSAMRTVAAERNADGRLEVFATNSGGQIFHRWQTSAGSARWSDWFPLDGALSSIAVARNSDGRLEIFGTNGQDMVFHRWQTTAGANTWSAWAQFDGALQQVAAETNDDGRIQLFGTDKEGRVFHRSQQGSGWTNWVQLHGVAMMKSVAVARNQDGRLELFGTTSSETVWHRAQTARNASTWTNWAQLNGSLRWVAAETNSAGRIEVFGVDRAEKVYRATQTAANASTWTSFLGLPRLTPVTGTVPALVGKSQTAAVSTLLGSFFTPGAAKFLPDQSCLRVGNVMSQTPLAGTQAILGSSVNYSIATEPPGGCNN